MEAAIDDWLESGAMLTSSKGSVILGWGVPRRSAAAEPLSKQRQFYFPGYFLETPDPWYHFPHTAELSVKRLLELLDSKSKKSPSKPLWTEPEQDSFVRAFDDLQRRFILGNLKKGVPYATQSSSESMGKDQFAASVRSVLSYVSGRPAYVYGLWNGCEGILGASPECLLLRTGPSTLETMACAGTAHSGRPLEEFLKDPKELYEHRLVIEDISLSLSPFGSVEPGKTEAVPFGKLHHLVTPIKLRLDTQFAFDAFVEALHPTAALGAFPRVPGMKWLKSFNCIAERQRFGAPAGYLDHGSAAAACYVAIRNVQWDSNGMKIMAGCGIVPDSKCESEWNEIKGKMQAIREVLAL